MLLRLLFASAALGGGLVLGNWFLAVPNGNSFAPTQVATAPAAKLSVPAPFAALVQQPAPAPVSITVSDSRAWPDATVSRVSPTAQANVQSTMTRDLQTELLRLGCYGGPIDGRWSAELQSALQDFTFRVNATLPINEPSATLVSLAKEQTARVCGPAASVTEQTAMGGEGGFLFDSGSGSGGLDGRMSLGGTAAVVPGSEQKPAPAQRPAVRKDDKLFLHPLGQL